MRSVSLLSPIKTIEPAKVMPGLCVIASPTVPGDLLLEGELFTILGQALGEAGVAIYWSDKPTTAGATTTACVLDTQADGKLTATMCDPSAVGNTGYIVVVRASGKESASVLLECLPYLCGPYTNESAGTRYASSTTPGGGTYDDADTEHPYGGSGHSCKCATPTFGESYGHTATWTPPTEMFWRVAAYFDMPGGSVSDTWLYGVAGGALECYDYKRVGGVLTLQISPGGGTPDTCVLPEAAWCLVEGYCQIVTPGNQPFKTWLDGVLVYDKTDSTISAGFGGFLVGLGCCAQYPPIGAKFWSDILTAWGK